MRNIYYCDFLFGYAGVGGGAKKEHILEFFGEYISFKGVLPKFVLCAFKKENHITFEVELIILLIYKNKKN